jgi:hypothetical protein
VAAVTDPFDPKATGLPEPSTGAHLITVSSNAPEHSFVQAVHAFQDDTKQVIRGVEARRGDMRVIPVALSAGRFAYVIEAGPLRVAHLGGMQSALTAEQVEALGAVDVLLLPAGGGPLTPKLAAEAAQAVNPRVVIPMAYSTPDMEGPAARLPRVDELVSATSWARVSKDSDIMLVSRPELPPSTEIWTLRFRR